MMQSNMYLVRGQVKCGHLDISCDGGGKDCVSRAGARISAISMWLDILGKIVPFHTNIETSISTIVCSQKLV